MLATDPGCRELPDEIGQLALELLAERDPDWLLEAELALSLVHAEECGCNLSGDGRAPAQA
jgi:hypothetical protein